MVTICIHVWRSLLHVVLNPDFLLQERKSVASAGLTVRKLTGDDIKPHHWEAFYQGYINTTGAQSAAWLIQQVMAVMASGVSNCSDHLPEPSCIAVWCVAIALCSALDLDMDMRWPVLQIASGARHI